MSEQVSRGSAGEYQASIPHETQWTIQALPTALSVQQQYSAVPLVRVMNSFRQMMFGKGGRAENVN